MLHPMSSTPATNGGNPPNNNNYRIVVVAVHQNIVVVAGHALKGEKMWSEINCASLRYPVLLDSIAPWHAAMPSPRSSWTFLSSQS